jgi:hypothetical protein
LRHTSAVFAPASLLPQYPDDLLFREPARLHVHGLAADIVSVKGETRSERWISSEVLWKWIDAHGKEFGIGRPYLDKDPPPASIRLN